MAEDIKIYNNIRFANRIDAYSSWNTTSKDIVLANGEFGIVTENNKPTAIVIGDGETLVRKMIRNPDQYGHRILYTHNKYKNPEITIPVASSTTIGGVMVGDEKTSGLRLDSGSLSNALIESYDQANQRFIIDKLHVNDLSFSNKAESTSFTGDVIELRDGQTTAAVREAGLSIKNLLEGFNGFLGLSTNNKIAIRETTGNIIEVVGTLANIEAKGLLQVDPATSYATIVPSKELVFKVDAVSERRYTPEGRENITIDLQPATIKVNNQIVDYNSVTKEYNINLSGGLSPENAEKLDNLSQLYTRVGTLETTAITQAEGHTDYITIRKVDGKITVTHDNAAVKRAENEEPTTSANTAVPVYLKNSDHETVVVPVLGDIKLDEAGHVIQKNYKVLEIYLPS